jgi:hypothetical protein
VPDDVEHLRDAALSHLTAEEIRVCVVYLATPPIARGETVTFPRLEFACERDGYIVFVDLDPWANWGHRCCYLCLDAESGDAERKEAQFPPFASGREGRPERQWQVIYQAPGVPDALLGIRPSRAEHVTPRIREQEEQ